MRRFVLLVPTRHGVGLTSVSLGLVRALEREGIGVAFVKPIAQPRAGYSGPERSTALIRRTTHLAPPEPIAMEVVEEALRTGQDQRMLEDVVARVRGLQESGEVVVIEGLVPTEEVAFAEHVNHLMARALDADVILVGAPSSADPSTEELVKSFSLAASGYSNDHISGCIVNKIRDAEEDAAPLSVSFAPGMPLARQAKASSPYQEALEEAGFKCVGLIPRREAFAAPRILDVARELDARYLNRGDVNRRVIRFRLAAMNVPNCLHALEPGCLVITPGDRHDVIMAASLASLRGVPLAGLLLTGGLDPDQLVVDLCSRAFELGLPMLQVGTVTLDAANRCLNMDREVPIDDLERVELVMTGVADGLDVDWLRGLRTSNRPPRLSPPAFRHLLIERARAAKKRIVLPEGTEPRTLAAAAICEDRGIAKCVLLAKPQQVKHVAADHGLDLPASLEIIDPELIAERYVEPLVELRKHKGVTAEEARNVLQSEVVLGAMMLAQGHVDGLVSGAVHTTADTVRPALQLVKTSPGAKLVSSVFFMCLPEQVLVYGDCAINPDPTAEELADIAVQSAASAEAFGIEPRVALISYSTGTSGAGADVEKVTRATELARQARPDLLIDGPLQYDAAVMPSVAKKKAPNSEVAGRASVLVFPDLNTGNTTYKAVQRSANVISIGPMLQGLARPVNDLSRGALIEDIVYTIALTAIQAVR